MSTVKFLSITSKDRHNAHVYFLIHVSLETINSSTYMLDCPGPAVTQLLYMRHMLNVCSQSVESWQQAREIGQLNPSRKKNHAENEPEILWINQQKNHTDIDCQSCTNDAILLIKHNVSSLVLARFFFNFRNNVIKCNTSVAIVFLSHTYSNFYAK